MGPLQIIEDCTRSSMMREHSSLTSRYLESELVGTTVNITCEMVVPEVAILPVLVLELSRYGSS